MKITSLQISNVLSFKYFENIEEAETITFDKSFNILIGQNGAGKSTVLEVINFVFRRVLFIPYDRNRDLYGQRTTIETAQKKEILKKINNSHSYKDFRLERNYDFEDKTQKIRILVEIDDIDKKNIKFLQDNKNQLSPIVGIYSAEQMFAEGEYKNEYVIDIELNSTDKTYTVNTQQDIGFTYLTAYNLYKEAVEIYNEENVDNQLSNLTESFALIGSYRNYSTYSPHVSLGGGNTADKQIQAIRTGESSKSTNASETTEPSVFGIVRLRMAKECFGLITEKKDTAECEEAANDLPFVKSINEKIKIVNLKMEVKLLDVSSWNFSFSFVDINRNRAIIDMKALSAGQKSIIHLVFEAYGRGNLSGGLVIIDEPEIHLHYQFQNEYLRVIEKLNEEQDCQYVLVTHSEPLVNSKTISNIIRLSLDEHDYTKINQPDITTDQKWLVKILDNKRSTHAFFGSKVLLVEGETDRYFFRAVLHEIEDKLKKGLSQDITVLDINEKNNLNEWRSLFGSFGLETFFITDLDTAFKYYPSETAYKLHTPELVSKFLSDHTDVNSKIEEDYKNGIFTFKNGDLEEYLSLDRKGISSVIDFCKDNLHNYWIDTTNERVTEIKTILSKITGEESGNL
ncbi:AAA family ATPase [Patescibacteria group bacterium]|nr:AAA family ATPase [Patescibacteria group bacterium]